MIKHPTSSGDAHKVLAKHGKTFALASKFMGKETSYKAARLYAFCRYLDDLVDERATIQSARNALRETRKHLLSGTGCDPVVADFLSLARDTSMDPALAAILIDGLESDLTTVAIDTQEELVQYAYRVAGVVGLMMCAVMNVKDSRALPFAIDLGIAMQLTNIARDIREDAAMGRRYIPGSWIDRLRARDLVAPSACTQAAVSSGLKKLLNLADDYYMSAALGLHYIPLRSQFAVRVARSVYREIGQLIRERDYNVNESRIIVGNARKVRVSLRALFSEPRESTSDIAEKNCISKLHTPLLGFPGVRVSYEGKPGCLA